MSTENAILWSQYLLSISVLLQSLELLSLRSFWSRTGQWPWSVIRHDLPGFLQTALSIFLGDRGLLIFLITRILACLVIPILSSEISLLLFLLIGNFLLFIRFRGPFNGGSDYMTTITTIGVIVALLDHPSAPSSGLAYIAFQSIASYFISGLVKLRQSGWRTGAALKGFIQSKSYATPGWVQSLTDQKGISFALSWFVIIFETGFPLVLRYPSISPAILIIGGTFHLINVYVFGLNRFFFAWLATYPAILYWSERLG